MTPSKQVASDRTDERALGNVAIACGRVRRCDACCDDATRSRAPAGRRAAIQRSVTLVAISKMFGAEAIAPVIACRPARVWRESRAGGQGKWPALRARHPGLELHLVGPLQSNKAKEAVALFDAIHSVDRPSLAEALAKEFAKQGRRPTLLVEVNTGGEPQKAGVLAGGNRWISHRLPRALRTGNRRAHVHSAGARSAGAALRLDRQDRTPQWSCAAVHGHERGFHARDRVSGPPMCGLELRSSASAHPRGTTRRDGSRSAASPESE